MSQSTEMRKAFWRGIGAAVATPLLIVSGAVMGSWPIMIALGIWHLEIDSRVPALGFWPVLGLSWGLGALVSKVRTKYDFGKVGQK
jgi:hypothetical protein